MRSLHFPLFLLSAVPCLCQLASHSVQVETIAIGTPAALATSSNHQEKKQINRFVLDLRGVEAAEWLSTITYWESEGLRVNGVVLPVAGVMEKTTHLPTSIKELWIPVVDRRSGLHHQKIRGAARALLQPLAQAQEVNLTPVLFPEGSGWIQESRTLRDVHAWLRQYSQAKNIGLLFPPTGPQEESDPTWAQPAYLMSLERKEAPASDETRSAWTALPRVWWFESP